MAHIVRTHESHDLLALVPALVGFRPNNSLVLVVFRGSRTAGAYRVNLPSPSTDLVYKRMATTLIGVLCKIRGADGVVPVVYTDDSFADCLGIPRESFVDRLMARAHTAGFDVKEALCVASDGWGSYFDHVDGTSPLPLALIDESPVKNDSVISRLDLSTPGERAELPPDDDARRSATAAALQRWRSALAGGGSSLPIGAEGGTIVLDDWSNPVGLAEVALSLDPDELDPSDAAVIVLAAQNPCTRDVLLFDWAWNAEIGRATHRLNLRFQRGQRTSESDKCALGLAGMNMPVPDPARMRRAIALLRRLAADAQATERPPLLTMLAWLHWALGHGSTAGLFVEAARAIDWSYGLAELLDTMLADGMLPEWVFDRRPLDDAPADTRDDASSAVTGAPPDGESAERVQ